MLLSSRVLLSSRGRGEREKGEREGRRMGERKEDSDVQERDKRKEKNAGTKLFDD